MLNAEQVETLEAQVDWIIQDKGIAFFDDPVALDLWRREGAIIGGADGNIVRASADWIRDLCRKAPRNLPRSHVIANARLSLAGRIRSLPRSMVRLLSAIWKTDGAMAILPLLTIWCG
jgi:trimethylamine:corrinoid methyltransferase-like protein